MIYVDVTVFDKTTEHVKTSKAGIIHKSKVCAFLTVSPASNHVKNATLLISDVARGLPKILNGSHQDLIL